MSFNITNESIEGQSWKIFFPQSAPDQTFCFQAIRTNLITHGIKCKGQLPSILASLFSGSSCDMLCNVDATLIHDALYAKVKLSDPKALICYVILPQEVFLTRF